jgi:hypothetical protein
MSRLWSKRFAAITGDGTNHVFVVPPLKVWSIQTITFCSAGPSANVFTAVDAPHGIHLFLDEFTPTSLWSTHQWRGMHVLAAGESLEVYVSSAQGSCSVSGYELDA